MTDNRIFNIESYDIKDRLFEFDRLTEKEYPDDRVLCYRVQEKQQQDSIVGLFIPVARINDLDLAEINSVIKLCSNKIPELFSDNQWKKFDITLGVVDGKNYKVDTSLIDNFSFDFKFCFNNIFTKKEYTLDEIKSLYSIHRVLCLKKEYPPDPTMYFTPLTIVTKLSDIYLKNAMDYHKYYIYKTYDEFTIARHKFNLAVIDGQHISMY